MNVNHISFKSGNKVPFPLLCVAIFVIYIKTFQLSSSNDVSYFMFHNIYNHLFVQINFKFSQYLFLLWKYPRDCFSFHIVLIIYIEIFFIGILEYVLLFNQ